MSSDDVLVISGATVVRATRLEQLDIVCLGERIAAIEPPGTVDVAGGRVIDAGGLHLFPGCVDAHVHLEEPGRTGWEGFDHGSAAAAAGGITTVVDMPIDSDPPTTSASLVRAKAAAAERSSRVDVALWGGLVPESVGRLDEMAEAGVVGLKAFACPSGWDDFPAVDEAALRAGFAWSARWGRPVALHAELEPLGHTDESEVAAVRWAAALAAEEAGHLHVVHVSSADAVDEAARWSGVTLETCPHYLTIDDDDVIAIGGEARCNPPIRSRANQDRLWAALADGRIGIVASDHSPCPTELKAGPEPWAGITGLDTFLPSLLDRSPLPLPALAAATTAAASMLGLTGKGAIAVGNDADLVLVDVDATWTVDPALLHNRQRRSPLIGRTLRGQVAQTFVRGRSVHDATNGPSPAGGGRVLRRPTP